MLCRYPVVVPGSFVAHGAASSPADHCHSLPSLAPAPGGGQVAPRTRSAFSSPQGKKIRVWFPSSRKPATPHRGVAFRWVRVRYDIKNVPPRKGWDIQIPRSPVTGLDLHFLPRRERKLECGFRRAGNQQHPTGVLHLNGFESDSR